MVSQQLASLASLRDLGNASGRHIRHIFLQETAVLCVPVCGLPVERVIFPKWDLQIVLSCLLKPPFFDTEGSDDVTPLQWRTAKTVFLLSLASARRRSLLHALSAHAHHIVWIRGSVEGHLIKLLPLPGFMAKNQLPNQMPEWITIPGIAHLNPCEPEKLLCPVRQLKLYLRDTSASRGDRHRLFLQWDPRVRDISQAHISRWIVLTVKTAHIEAGLNYGAHVTANEVQAIASSWAYSNQVALSDVMAAAFWRSSGVSQNSYFSQGFSTLCQ